MKVTEIRSLDLKRLREKLSSLRMEVFLFSLKSRSDKKSCKEYRENKKSIAKILTVMSEVRKRG